MTFALAIFDVKTSRFYPVLMKPFGEYAEACDYRTDYTPEILKQPSANLADVLEGLETHVEKKRVLHDYFLWAFDIDNPSEVNFVLRHMNYLGTMTAAYVHEEGSRKIARWERADRAASFAGKPKSVGIIATVPNRHLTDGLGYRPLTFVYSADLHGGIQHSLYKLHPNGLSVYASAHRAMADLITSEIVPDVVYEMPHQSMPLVLLPPQGTMELQIKGSTACPEIKVIAREELQRLKPLYGGQAQRQFTPVF